MDKIRTLLIEDNPVDVLLLREALGQDALNSFDLTAVERLHSAIETLQKNEFDVILLDLGLPDSQGFEAFTRIHQLVPEIPKVILSGLTDEALALRAVHMGAQDYIVKGTAGFSAAARAIRYAIERNKGQQQLRESEERFRYLFENNPHPMWAYDLKTLEFLAVNDAAVDKYGYTRDEFLRMTITDIRPNEDVERLKKHLELPRPSLQHSGEWRHKLKDGTLIDVDISSHTLNLSGRETALVVAQDITERRRAEAAVRASEERFRAMIENGLDDISLLDINGNLLWESPAVVRNLGYPENAFVGQNIFEIVHPEDKAWTSALYARLIEVPGSRQEGKFRLQRSDGTWRWVEAIVTNMLDNPSVQAIVVNYRDITERKQAEENYQSIFERSAEGIFQSSPEGRYINVNPAMARIYGYASPQEMIESIDDIAEQIYLEPQDRTEFTRLFNVTGSVENFEMKNKRRDGSIIWTSTTARAISAADGKLLYYEGFLQDITERKQAEATIRSLAKFPEENPDPIIRIGKDGQIIYANTASHQWLAAWGVSLNDPLPDEWQVLVADAYQRDTKQALDISIQDRVYAILIVPFPGEGYTNIYGQDVTESKRAEDKLRYQANLLANINDAVVAVDDQYRITNWNHAAEVIYGWRAEEVLGRNGKEIIRTNYSVEQLQAQMEILIATGELHVESVNYRKDNELIWVDTRSSLLRGADGTFEGLVSVNRDITERKRIEEALKETSEQFRTLFEASPEAIMIVDPHGDWPILDCNATGCAMNGYTRAELIGQPVDIFNMTPGKPTERSEYLEHVRKAGILRYETSHRHKDGTVFPVEVSTSLITLGGREVVLGIDRDITERKRAEESLRESEALYRQAIEVAGAVPYRESYSDNGNSIKYEFIGEGIRQITGYGPEEFSAKLWDSLVDEVNLVEDLSGYSLDEGIQRVRSGETLVWKCEHRIRDRAGKIHWVFEAAVEVRDEHGVAYGSIGTYQDITTRKQAEGALRESEQRYRALFEEMPVAIWEEDFSEIKKYLNSLKVQGITDFQAYFESNPDAALECANKIRILDVNNTAVKMFRGESREQLLNIAEQEVSRGEREHLVEFITDIAEGKTSNHWEGEDETFTGDPIEIGLNWSVVPGYENDYSKVIVTTTDITERKQAEEKLHASEVRYRALFENAPDGIFIANPDGNYIDVNQSAAHMLGYTRAELIGMSISDIVLETETPRIEPELVEIKTNRSYQREWQFKRKDGSVFIGEVVGTLMPDGSLLGFGRDINERKQAEEKLRESEARFASIFHTNPTRVCITSFEDGRFLDVNESFLKSTGYSREEVLGHTSLEFNDWVHPQDRVRLRTLLEKQGNVQNFETQLRKKSGEILDILISAELVDLFGQRCILSVGLDITERKRDEQKLQESNERFEQLANNIEEAFWITASTGEEVYLSPATEKIWGKPVNALMSPNAFLEYVHPEDRQAVEVALDKQGQGEKTALEYRILQPDGSVRWVWDRAFPIFDESGRVVRLAGIAADVTERKQSEKALRESEVRLRQVIDLVPHFIFAKDMEGRFILANQAVAEAYGTTVDKLINKLDADFAKSDEEARRFRSADLDVINSGQARFIPEENITDANGNTRILSTTKIPFTFSGSSALAILGVSIDITERKLAEKALRESEVRFAGVVNSAMDAVISMDSEQRIVLFNPAAEQMFGCKASEAIGGLLERFIPARYRTQHKEHIIRFGQTGDTSRSMGHLIALSGLRSDGTEFPIEASISHIETGGEHLYTVILRDITEYKKAETETLRHVAELQALYENGLAVGRLLQPKEIGERIITTFAKYLSWHHVAIRLKEPEGNNLHLIAFNQGGLNVPEINDIQSLLNSSISNIDQGLSGWVVQTGQPLRTGNVHTQPRYVDTYPNIQSGLYMPLKIGETVIGVISVESDDPDAFTEQDERLLATLANQTAIAFENARLYQSTQQELQERKRMEAALRTSETHYRELADSITDIFFELDQNLCYSHWNKASEKLTGIPEAEAIGKSMYEILGVSQEQIRIERIYESVLLSQHATTFETHFNFDNQVRTFEVNAYPSTNGVSVVAKDVTERKRSETIMQKRFELMEYAAQHTLEETMQKTIDEVINFTDSTIGFFQLMEIDQTTPGLQIWSTNTFKLFNVAASEGQHQSVEQAGVWADAVRQRRAIIHNDYESLPNKKALPTGHASITREMVIPIIRNERILAVMGIGNKSGDYIQQDLDIAERFADYAWDITERKQMEVALADERNQLSIRVEERTADLSRANANLGRALRVKDEFLANMSHELRTPLNAILGLSESLAEQTAGPLNEKQQRYITTVSESGHHLLSLINDILDLAKIEAGQIELDVNKVDIQSVCDASMRMIKQLARKKNQDMVVEIDGKLGLMWADERRLKQMLVNLLSNAVKFTPEGGKLGLEVRGDQDENKVTFTIWDTGIGIKETDLPRLFQPFVQLDAGLARESSGTGLGLALVAQMARMHGGSASVVSEPGKGSRFSIMLPWEPALVVDTIERLKITGKFKPVKFNKDHKPTILLIEDTEEVIMMLSDYLQLNGFKTITARDGLEGITQAQLTHPDLILMDIQMPHLDGFETTKKLRSEPKFKTTPIIALTALAMPNDRELCLAAGMDEYITKPVHLRALVKIIELFLSGETEVKSP